MMRTIRKKATLLLAGAGATLAAAKIASDLSVRNYEDVSLQETVPPGKIAWVEGIRIHYDDAGSGPALVLLHGLGASIFSLRKNIPDLARSFRVIAPDMPGYGLSSREASDLSLTAQSLYLEALLDQIDVHRVSIVGHSMGGSVAQRFALRRPDRVERLVLIASTTDGFMRSASWASRLLRPFIPLFVTLVLHGAAGRRLWSRAAVYDQSYLTPEILAGYAAPGHIRGHTSAYQRLMVDRAKDKAIDASQIRAPTLLVWGERDRIVSIEQGRRLHDAIRGSRLVVVPRAGHWVMEEQPESVNRLIRDFLEAPAGTEKAVPSAERAAS